MTHSHQSQDGSGTVQGTDSQTVLTGASKEKSREGPHLSHWFWGTIALLLVIALTLNLLAAWQTDRQDIEDTSGRTAGDQAETEATLVERWLNTAETKAGQVKGQIGPLLDKAYAPVYDGVPAYMDFHYSLKGEWLELGAAALGDIGAGLDKHLFVGLETRLKNVAEELERGFDERYQSALNEAVVEQPGSAVASMPVVTKAIDDAKIRIMKTAGTVAGAAVGGASLKALTKVFAKKLGTKLAAKVAAKTGTKWAAVASGAGAGAGVCSWTGPGAVGCAVVGAVITWIGIDLAMVKLDEYVTREDFEGELRELINNQKEVARRALEEMLDGKRQAAVIIRKVVIQDVLLSELKDADRLVACQWATDILASYVSFLENLQARSPENIETLRIGLTEQAENHLLAPWVDEMAAAIVDQDFRPWVYSEVSLSVDLPQELQEERKMRAALLLGQTSLDFAWTVGASDGHFTLSARPEDRILLEGSQLLELELVQDRGWRKLNRSFNVVARFDAYESLAEGSGLMPKAKISLTMFPKETEEPSPQVTLELPLTGVALEKREMPEFCTK